MTTLTTLPTFHLNGTSAESIFYEYHNAMKAAEALRTAVANTTCNQRDFYPQSDEAWHDAKFERAEIFAKIDDIVEYLSAWAEHANNNH
jgi:hypothetical protein